MEAIGAVASIIQVAQLGTQVSITLYHVAQTIKSANKDTKYIAKDIALFCTVLKGLAKALEAGQNTRLFRQNAFDTSLKICAECKSVFVEIEDVLKQVTRVDNPLDGNFTLARSEKLMWYFRKGKVEFLRGVLESLKSTIMLEMAVLNYAMGISTKENTDQVNTDELLAIKSLVLAKETATEELRTLQNSSETVDTVATSNPSHQAMSLNREILCGGVETMEASGDQHVGAIHMPESEISYSKESDDMIEQTEKLIAESCTQVDRLEFALQRLYLAIWEQDRWEKKIKAMEKPTGRYWVERPSVTICPEAIVKNRLRPALLKFGMDEQAVDSAIKILQGQDNMLHHRISVKQKLLSTDFRQSMLRGCGLIDESTAADTGEIVLQRWLPNMFSDFLWDRTRQYILKAGIRADETHLLLEKPIPAGPLPSSVQDNEAILDYSNYARRGTSWVPVVPKLRASPPPAQTLPGSSPVETKQKVKEVGDEDEKAKKLRETEEVKDKSGEQISKIEKAEDVAGPSDTTPPRSWKIFSSVNFEPSHENDMSDTAITFLVGEDGEKKAELVMEWYKTAWLKLSRDGIAIPIVILVGGEMSDIDIVFNVNILLARRGSPLEQYCIKIGLTYTPYETLVDIRTELLKIRRWSKEQVSESLRRVHLGTEAGRDRKSSKDAPSSTPVFNGEKEIAIAAPKIEHIIPEKDRNELAKSKTEDISTAESELKGSMDGPATFGSTIASKPLPIRTRPRTSTRPSRLNLEDLQDYQDQQGPPETHLSPNQHPEVQHTPQLPSVENAFATDKEDWKRLSPRTAAQAQPQAAISPKSSPRLNLAKQSVQRVQSDPAESTIDREAAIERRRAALREQTVVMEQFKNQQTAIREDNLTHPSNSSSDDDEKYHDVISSRYRDQFGSQVPHVYKQISPPPIILPSPCIEAQNAPPSNFRHSYVQYAPIYSGPQDHGPSSATQPILRPSVQQASRDASYVQRSRRSAARTPVNDTWGIRHETQNKAPGAEARRKYFESNHADDAMQSVRQLLEGYTRVLEVD